MYNQICWVFVFCIYCMVIKKWVILKTLQKLYTLDETMFMQNTKHLWVRVLKMLYSGCFSLFHTCWYIIHSYFWQVLDSMSNWFGEICIARFIITVQICSTWENLAIEVFLINFFSLSLSLFLSQIFAFVATLCYGCSLVMGFKRWRM